MSELNIVEAFGKFIIQTEKGPKMFDDLASAEKAAVEFKSGAEHREIASNYCANRGLEGKNAQGKINVITDFLAWVEAGSPEAAPVVEDEADATADVEADEDNTEF